MEIVVRSVSELVLDPNNARKHSKKNLEAIKGSLTKFGQQKPIVIDGKGVILAGNGTLAAAQELGWSEIQCVVTTLEGFNAAAYALADNRSSELAEWDTDVLSETLKGLMAAEFDIEQIGFDDSFLKIEAPTFEGDPDDVPENVETRCKPGDLWQLGNHRLLCGDSTNVQHVERLMGGEKADLCFTSPPYGQQRDYGLGKVSDWDELMNGVFSIVPVTDSAQVLVNLGMIHRENEWIPYWDKWIQFMQAAGWKRFGLYVWDQGFGLPGNWNGRLAPSFELVFHFNRKSLEALKVVDKKPENIKARKGGASTMRGKDGVCREFSSPEASANTKKIADSVIRINRMHGGHGIDHPAIFPVELPEHILNSWPGDLAYEPFSGSGSTLIACEKTNRKCYGMEIDPKYCDVILERWEKFTNKKAELCPSLQSS